MMPLPLTVSVKSRLVLPFWYRLTWVVPVKEPLNGCVCVCVSVCGYNKYNYYTHLMTFFSLLPPTDNTSAMMTVWRQCDFSSHYFGHLLSSGSMTKGQENMANLPLTANFPLPSSSIMVNSDNSISFISEMTAKQQE